MTERLCDKVARKASLEELRRDVRGAKFLCAGCARAAVRADLLCEPKPL